MNVGPVVAIDGPAGAGKSSVARRVALALGVAYVDTGAMYRAVGLRVAAADDPDAALRRAGAEARAARIETTWDAATGEARILLDGADVTAAVRSPEAARWASLVASRTDVREVLVERQRELGRGGVVMEGRDIGTVVFPEARHKFFLDAAPDVRAQRRQGEEHRETAAVAADLQERDRRDRTRMAAPLRPAADATRVDTTGLDLEEVVAAVLRAIREDDPELA